MLNFVRNRIAVFLHDLAWIPISIYGAFWIRFNISAVPEQFYTGIYWMIGIALPIYAFLYWFFGLYRGVWRFASIPDLIRVIKAVFIGVLATSLAIFILQRSMGVPRSVFLLYPLLLTLGLVLPRVFYRWIKDHHIRHGSPERQRALIVGAGQAGEVLIRNLNRGKVYLPVALADSNPAMVGMEIHGLRVEGQLRDLPELIKKLAIQEVLLASAELKPEEMKQVIASCAQAGIPCRTYSSRIGSDGAWVGDAPLRPITVEDLLPREPISLNLGDISGLIEGRSILVTGGGGSIGSELCRQLAERQPEKLIIFDASEYNLFQIDQIIRREFPHLRIYSVLGDIKDRHRVDWTFSKFRPDVVFHAAAYKHVPLLESNPIQGVHNNVFGTKILADAANDHKCEKFVLISTDKAVNPANVMGVTKRIAEIYCQNLNAHSFTRFMTTRFGNVLGSAGSVVPVFAQQIAQGGPVKVTHPEVTRFFMTTGEAVGLILQAGAMGEGGEIFVLDMGHPMKIKELAEQMIRLAGLEPIRDIPIVYTGLREGEKLNEELFHESEGLKGTGHPKLLLAMHRKLNWDWLAKQLIVLENATRKGNLRTVLAELGELVPEFNRSPHEREEPQTAKAVTLKFPQGR